MHNFFQLGSCGRILEVFDEIRWQQGVLLSKYSVSHAQICTQDMYRSLGDMWWWQLVVLMVAYSVSYAQISAV